MLAALAVILLVAQAGPGGSAPDLAGCLREAMERHPELGLARLGLDLARAGQKATWSGYLPSLSAHASDGYAWSAARHDDTHSVGLQLSQTLWNGGRYYLEPRRAEVDLRRAEATLETRRADVALEVVLAYLELQKALRTEVVLEEAVQLSQGQLELAEERKRLGDASRVDVSRARVALGEDRIALERQRSAVREARVRLAVAIGRPPGEPMEVAPLRDAAGEEDLPAGGPLPAHPQLRESQLLEEVAGLDVDLATAGHWPTLTGNLSYSHVEPSFTRVYSRPDELYNLSLGLTLSVPLFEGFATQAAVEAAAVRADQVRAERRVLEQGLDAAAVEARVGLEALREVRVIEAENSRAAEDSLALAEERYRVGEGTALEARDAQLAVTRAHLSQVQTEFDMLAARARYHHARGDLLATYLGEEEKP